MLHHIFVEFDCLLIIFRSPFFKFNQGRLGVAALQLDRGLSGVSEYLT
jgi:hypothetical protein